jgi:hypothetical protein
MRGKTAGQDSKNHILSLMFYRHWANGGPTTLSNLALLCRRHYRAWHETGTQAPRQFDDTLGLCRPDGRPLPDVPPPVAEPPDPFEPLRAHHRALGLALDARTAILTLR